MMTAVSITLALALLALALRLTWLELGAASSSEGEAVTAPAATTTSQCKVREDLGCACEVGNYRLLSKLGAGGMGEVFTAQHTMLRRPTAIKLLRPGVSADLDIARFEREAQLTSELTHPNTVRVFDYGRTDDGVYFYAMEHLEGADLATVIDRTGPMDAARVVRVLTQVAGSLAEAHDRGFVHRDIKPANLFLQSGYLADQAKVLDFGLAREVAPHNPRLSAPDTIAGTPYYMAPEAIADTSQTNASSDVYSLGCVAYFMLTGRHVFTGRSPVEVFVRHLNADPAPMRGVPPALEALVLACLDKDPSTRPSANELQERAQLLEAQRWARWSDERAHQWWHSHSPQLAKALDTASVPRISAVDRQAITVTRRRVGPARCCAS